MENDEVQTIIELENLKMLIESDDNLSELRINGINYVPGNGKKTSPKLMFIGEAPGPIENAKRVPFTGKAGRIFYQLLTKYNFPLDNLYITNVVKYMPIDPDTGKFRKPTQQEIEIFSVYLGMELSIIAPEYICLMGATAVEALFGKEAKLSGLVGNMINDKDVPFWIYVTNHPSLIQYKQEIRPQLERHFKELSNYINGTSSL